MKFSNRLTPFILAAAFFFTSAFTPAPAGAGGDDLQSYSSASIRIIRDEFGVPHVYARNIFDLYFGYGYVTAEDRLFQIETLRRSVSGGVSEVFGADFLELDRSALRDGYSVAEIQRLVDRADPVCAKLLEMFARGVNKKIREFAKTPDAMPAEFKKFGFAPKEWRAADVASIYVGTMAVRYSDFTSELDNLALLNHLREKYGEKKAMEIFEDIVPVNDENSAVTITDPNPHSGCGDCRGSLAPGASREAQDALRRLASPPRASLRAGLAERRAALAKLGLPSKLGSYTYLVSAKKSETGAAILASGPQMGFFNPAYLFEVGLHSPEIDVIGTTTPCYMNIMFGMNRDLAFTATAGVGNLTDVYAEKLNPADQSEYFFNGAYRKFERRSFDIKVKGRRRPVKAHFLRSVHGPVFAVDKKAGVAYSRKRAWEGLELDSMFHWMAAVNAKNFGEMKFHFSKNPISINIFAVNRRGETYHYLSGRYPVRHPDFDDRLPLPGAGIAEWRGFSPGETNPSSKNENEGFIANWNSKPAPGFRNGDLATQWGPDQRTVFIQDMMRARPKYGLADLYRIHERIGHTDLRAYLYAPMLLKFIESSPARAAAPDPCVEAVRAALAAWDFERRDDNGDGRYDSPAVAVFDALWSELMAGLFADELGDMLWAVDSDPTWTQSILLYYTLQGACDGVARLNHDYTNGAGFAKVFAAAAERALKKLEKEFKTADRSKWLKPVQKLVFETGNFVKAPQADPADAIETFMVNRGTENHFIEMGENYTLAFNINPPGQSGYNPLNPRLASAHRRDQMALFEKYKGYKPMRFAIEDVLKNKTTEKFIFAD